MHSNESQATAHDHSVQRTAHQYYFEVHYKVCTTRREHYTTRAASRALAP